MITVCFQLDITKIKMKLTQRKPIQDTAMIRRRIRRNSTEPQPTHDDDDGKDDGGDADNGSQVARRQMDDGMPGGSGKVVRN